jgi:hypothetical protein
MNDDNISGGRIMDNKELRELYKIITDIKEDTASTRTTVDFLLEDNKRVETIKDLAVSANNKADHANKRIDKIDKWIFAINSAIAIAIIGAILNLIIK